MKIINHSKFIIELENFLDDGLCDEIVHGVETNEVYKNNLCEKTRVRHNKSINITIDERFKKVDDLVHDVITAILIDQALLIKIVNHEIITEKEDFYKIKSQLEKKVDSFAYSAIEWRAQNYLNFLILYSYS